MSKREVSSCLVFLVFLIMAAILASDPGLGQVRFDEPVSLSKSHTVNINSEIVAAGDQVLVYWNDFLFDSYILAAHSSDRGMTFRPWNLSAEMPRSWPPTAAVDEDNVYVAWLGFPDLSDLFTTGMFLARSNNRGESFEPPFDITGRGGGGEANIRIQNGIMNIAWEGRDRRIECCSYYKSIFFAKSTDLGASFTQPVRASSNPIGIEWGIGSVPELALDGNNVYVAWLGGRPDLMYDDMYFASSTDGGKSFRKTLNLSNNTDFQGITYFPQLAVSGNGYVYAAWAQGERYDYPLLEIYFARSIDGGETFSKPLNLSNNSHGSNGQVQIVAAGDNVYIVWAARGGLLFSRSTDAGETLSEPKYIARAGNPQIAVIEKGKLLDQGITEDIIYLVCQAVPKYNDVISFSVSLDGGVTFSKPQIISDIATSSHSPRLAAVGKNVYVTWTQGRDAIFIRGQLELSNKTR